jgi:cyclophilin family peptidyl-prolyl cis-trans isomerase
MKSFRFACASFVAALALSGTATAAEPVIVDLVTSEGEIRIELDAEKAPKTVANFVNYVKSGHYDGMTADLREKKTEPPVVNEAANGLKNLKYTLAMARTSNPNSATSQFFINVADNAFLDRANSPDGHGYAVFGKVVAGKEVVDKIAAKKTTVKRDPINGIPMEDVPAEAITIVSATLVEAQ